MTSDTNSNGLFFHEIEICTHREIERYISDDCRPVNISALSKFSARTGTHRRGTRQRYMSSRGRLNVGASCGTSNGRVQATASPPTNVRIEFERHAPNAEKATVHQARGDERTASTKSIEAVAAL